MRIFFCLVLSIFLGVVSRAQNVTVIGSVTPGNVPVFNSPTVIKDSGTAGGAAGFANPTGAVGLTTVNGSALTALRSDAAPPLSASVQSSLTGTSNQLLLGTGAFGVAALGSLGTTTTVLHGNAAGAPAFSAVSLATDVTGTLPLANGGLGGSQVAATVNQIPVFPGGGGAAVPTTIGGVGGLFDTICSLTIGQAWVRLTGGWGCTSLGFVNVVWFGAACNGSTNDATAIQNAINSLPNDGGIVTFPVANCVINSTITIGNGTTSAVSTKRGVILRGVANPNSPTGLPSLNGYTAAVGPKLTWGGGANPMISIAGPLQGWGIQNLFLDCASVTGSSGIGVVSGQFGENLNLTVQNCGSVGISSLTNPLGGYTGVGNVDALRNNWTNIFVLVPNVAAAKGILLNGDSGGTSDTDYNTFTNVFIRGAGTAATFGLYLGVNDANLFQDLSISGFATAGIGMEFDYSINSNFPGSDTFIHYEIGGSTPFAITGSPGGGATPNKFYGLIQANGAPAPILANTQAIDGPWIAFTPSLACGTATFTLTSARSKIIGKTTQADLDFTITAIGTCTNSVSFALPNTANTGGSLNGAEVGNTNNATACRFVASATSGSCVMTGGANYAVNAHVVASGVYENQ